MSDAATAPVAPDLPNLIMSVSEPIWAKISKALAVKTREEAVQMVQADENAAAIVAQIIKGRTALEEESEVGETALTEPQSIEIPSAADRMYGTGGKAKLDY